MLIEYRLIACCLFLLSYLFIGYFCMFSFFRCCRYLVNKDVYGDISAVKEYFN